MGREPLQLETKRLLGVDETVLHGESCALQIAHLDLGVGGDIFEQQDADAFGQCHCYVLSSPGTRLVSTQYSPIFATVTRKASNSIGLTM